MLTYLGHVERVERVLRGLLQRHDLDAEGPSWKVAVGDRVVQVAESEVGILAGHHGGFVVRQVPDALVSLGTI